MADQQGVPYVTASHPEAPPAVEQFDEDVTALWLPVFVGAPTFGRTVAWIVAVGGGLALAYAVLVANAAPGATLALFLFSLAVPALMVIDTVTLLLPNRVMYPAAAAAAVGAVASAATGVLSLTDLVVALGCGAAGFALYFVVLFIAPVGGFGFGDVRLAGILGFLLGLNSPLVALLGVVCALPVTAVALVPVMLAVRSQTAKHEPFAPANGSRASVPFGPLMLAGFAVLALWPDQVVALLTR